MAEPDKRVCWLTDIDPIETDANERKEQMNHHARLYLRGSLHAVVAGATPAALTPDTESASS